MLFSKMVKMDAGDDAPANAPGAMGSYPTMPSAGERAGLPHPGFSNVLRRTVLVSMETAGAGFTPFRAQQIKCILCPCATPPVRQDDRKGEVLGSPAEQHSSPDGHTTQPLEIFATISLA